MTDYNQGQQFDQPDAGGDKLPFKERGADLLGALVLIQVHEVIEKIKTIHTRPGEEGSDAVRADVAVLSGPLAGEYFGNTLIFPKVLVSSLRGKLGKQVLGRFGQGQAKPGQNAAWTLMPYTDPDIPVAQDYLARTPAFGKGQPMEEPPQAAPGWGTQTATSGWGSRDTSGGWGGAAAAAPPSKVDRIVQKGAPQPLALALDAAGITDAEIERLTSLDAGWQRAQAGQIMAVLRPPQQQGWGGGAPSNEPPF